jgi:hypothetical protein
MNRVRRINHFMDAAVTAVAAGDYATARQNALAAQGLIATLPRASRSAGTGGGTQSAEWDAEAVAQFVRRLTIEDVGAQGIQQLPVEFTNPTLISDGNVFATYGGSPQ